MIRPQPPTTRGRRRRGDEGELEVFVADEQDAQPVDVARWEALARGVLEAEGVAGEAELALMFVDEATMAELNGTFMGADGPTDVLAFPIDDDEIALLVVHGILHVLGMDHATPEETEVMQARERELLGRFHRSVR